MGRGKILPHGVGSVDASIYTCTGLGVQNSAEKPLPRLSAPRSIRERRCLEPVVVLLVSNPRDQRFCKVGRLMFKPSTRFLLWGHGTPPHLFLVVKKEIFPGENDLLGPV